MDTTGLVAAPDEAGRRFTVELERRLLEVPAVEPGAVRTVKRDKKDKKSKSGLARGTDTFFRNGYRAQIGLTQLADNKANIMISINGVIVSVLIVSSGLLASRELALLVPAFVLLLTCLASIVYAVLAARPQIDASPRAEAVTSHDVRSGRGVLLFFGTFTQISEDDYVTLTLETLKDDKRIYAQMSQHIYQLGEGLKRKFRLLHLSYTVFIIGLSLSIATFIASFAMLKFG